MSKGKKTDRVTIELPPEKKQAFIDYAHRIGTNPSCLIRSFIYQTIEQQA